MTGFFADGYLVTFGQPNLTLLMSIITERVGNEISPNRLVFRFSVYFNVSVSIVSFYSHNLFRKIINKINLNKSNKINDTFSIIDNI